MKKKFKVGDVVINIGKDRMVKVNDGEPLDEDCFCGTSIASDSQVHIDDTDNCWLIDKFEVATKENTPKEWWEHLPSTIADVAKENTDIMRGKNELKIGDFVKIVTCHEGDNVVLGDLIGKVGIIDGFYGSNEIAEIYFGQLPEHAIISGWELHDCEGKYKESKYFRLGKEYLELIERKQDTECSNGKEDKYQVIKLSPTENQERQYGVMLIKNLTEIIEGKTIAFINSKGSGGVIYGRKANGLLNKLVISNPNKHITVVKTVKAHGKKEEAIKQLSIKIEDRIEPSEFVL